MNIRMPSWEDVVERMDTKVPSDSDFLLSSHGGACTDGEITVFCGRSYYTTLPIVHYLIEQIAFTEDPIRGNDILVLCSGSSSVEFLKRLAFSMAGIDCWRLEHELKAKSVCSEYAERYEEACAKIKASDLNIVPLGITEIEDIQDEIKEEHAAIPRLIIIDDLLSCRCRGCNGDEHGWSMVGNRLHYLANFWEIPIVAMMPVSMKQLDHRAAIFDHYGSLQNYIQRACLVRKGNHEGDTDSDVRQFVFESIFGCRGFDSFTMNYNTYTHRLFD